MEPLPEGNKDLYDLSYKTSDSDLSTIGTTNSYVNSNLNIICKSSITLNYIDESN